MFLALAAMPAPVHAQTIGRAAAVQPDAHTRLGTSERRILRVGSDVVYRQRIETSATGSVQVLFVDRTTLNIGPNSELVIDEFVFDRNRNAGHMAATLTRGVLRFVGGQTSHTGGATIRTPATTLGVRGGVAVVRHEKAGGTRVVSHFGAITAATSSGQEVLNRAGLAMTVAGAGQSAGAPKMASRAELDAAIPATRSARSGGGKGRGGAGGGGALGGGAADSAASAARGGAQQSLSTSLKSFVPPTTGGGGSGGNKGDTGGKGNGGNGGNGGHGGHGWNWNKGPRGNSGR